MWPPCLHELFYTAFGIYQYQLQHHLNSITSRHILHCFTSLDYIQIQPKKHVLSTTRPSASICPSRLEGPVRRSLQRMVICPIPTSYPRDSRLTNPGSTLTSKLVNRNGNVQLHPLQPAPTTTPRHLIPRHTAPSQVPGVPAEQTKN